MRSEINHKFLRIMNYDGLNVTAHIAFSLTDLRLLTSRRLLEGAIRADENSKMKNEENVVAFLICF